MLRQLRFTNFKAWPEATVDCAQITGVFGTNSSGKTSLIQFLLLLKQTKDATDRAVSVALNGELVGLGTIGDAIHQHNENATIKWSLTFEPDARIELRDPSAAPTSPPFAESEIMTVSSEITVRGEAPIASSLSYTVADQTFSLRRKPSSATKFALLPSSSQPSPSGFSFVRNPGRAWELPGPVKGYAFPDQSRTYFQNSGFLADLQAVYERQLDDLFYLGPLRDDPRRDYLWARSRPTDVGLRGEKAIDAILAATEAKEKLNLAHRSKLMPFQAMVAHWLKHMGLIEQFRVEEIAKGSNRWQAKVVTRPGASEVLLPDVGFGVSQVLPVVTLLLYVPEGSTVILEQPEIHLHPLAQAALADVIIYAATHRRVQVLLESHSEHLLLRLQRRIAEGKISSKAVALYFCDAPSGAARLSTLIVDLLGRIENWPDHFMGDAFGETADAERARLQRVAAE
jgi:predicted ATPase